MTLAPIQAPHEPYAHLYVGDYFADTLDLAAHEHQSRGSKTAEEWRAASLGSLAEAP